MPFTTRRQDPESLSFAGDFVVSDAGLSIRGTVDLTSLDEGLRGHAALNLSVTKEGVLLGEGRLLPGHFAEIEQGYRIGFAGLEKWSEIDISRRNYGAIVLAGLFASLVGALSWAVARWVER